MEAVPSSESKGAVPHSYTFLSVPNQNKKTALSSCFLRLNSDRRIRHSGSRPRRHPSLSPANLDSRFLPPGFHSAERALKGPVGGAPSACALPSTREGVPHHGTPTELSQSIRNPQHFGGGVLSRSAGRRLERFRRARSAAFMPLDATTAKQLAKIFRPTLHE